MLVLVETESPTVSRTPAQIATDGDESPDADPGRRVVVRLTEVVNGTDPSGLLFPGGTSDVTEIRWHERDALPFPLCLSVTKGDREIAVAWGNLVLADHGETVTGEALGAVPAPTLTRVSEDPCGDGTDPALVVPARFRPALGRRPLTQAAARPHTVLAQVPLTPALEAELDGEVSADLVEAVFAGLGLVVPDGSPVRGGAPLWSVSVEDHAWLLRSRTGSLQVLAEADPATAAARAVPRETRPALRVLGDLEGTIELWLPQPDLLASGPLAPELTVEVEHDGRAHLRFGDGEHGLRPARATTFAATYRVGNGVAGNVGRNALSHLVTAVGDVTGVRNPLPAAGGVDPESGEEVRRDAPQAFAVPERAVTEPDYASVAERHEEVQRAAATFRWTGSWHTAFVTADRFGGRPVDAPFEGDLRAFLERFRMAGYDLEVDAPVFVPLALGLHVCVLPGHFRSPVGLEVREVLSAQVLPDGRLGLFHPDNLTFGSPVHLSTVLAAVHGVPGVQSVQVKVFERLRVPGSSGISTGVLPMGRLEIAAARRQPQLPRARRARPDLRGRHMSQPVHEPHQPGSTCGCCAGTTVRTPGVVDNRPGLPAIAYRSGVHGDFVASMLAGLTRRSRPGLAGLRTRDPDDPTIALLDAWAVACDVLTFYTERLANERYLRTARDRTSLQELGKLVGLPARPRRRRRDPPGVHPRTATGAAARWTRTGPRAGAAGRARLRATARRAAGAERAGARRDAADLRDGGGDRGPPGVERAAGRARPAPTCRRWVASTPGSPAPASTSAAGRRCSSPATTWSTTGGTCDS